MKNNRIAIDVRMLGASGIGTYIEALLREFVRLKHNFQFVLIGNGEKIEKLVGKSGRFIVQHTDVPVFSISEQFYLPKLARDADLFHSPHHNVPVFWRKKLIVTFHDGETIRGRVLGSMEMGCGFFLLPADPTGNNEKIFVVTDALEEVTDAS